MTIAVLERSHMKASTILFTLAACCLPSACFAGDIDKAEKIANEILSKMTLEEKISLCHGNGTMSINAIPRVGLKQEFWMSDGPNTVNEEVNRDDGRSAGRTDDQSTALPTLSALAATWDTALATRFGAVIGEEAATGVRT